MKRKLLIFILLFIVSILIPVSLSETDKAVLAESLYTVSYDGTLMTVNSGNLAPNMTPSAPICNVTFRGWFTESGTEYDFSKPVNSDITLISKWYIEDSIKSVVYEESFSRYHISFNIDYGTEYVIASGSKNLIEVNGIAFENECYLNKFGSNYLNIYTSQNVPLLSSRIYHIKIKGGVDLSSQISLKSDISFWVCNGVIYYSYPSSVSFSQQKITGITRLSNEPTVNGGRYWLDFDEYTGPITQFGLDNSFFLINNMTLYYYIDDTRYSSSVYALKNGDKWVFGLEISYSKCSYDTSHKVTIKKNEYGLLKVQEDLYVYTFKDTMSLREETIRVSYDDDVVYVKYGDYIENICVERSGYIFDGWYSGEEPFDFSQEIKEDTNLKSHWIKEEYVLTFMADGKEVQKVSYNVETEKITNEPKVPVKSWYSGEWEEYFLWPKDITINAVYTPVSYTAMFYADGKLIKTDTLYENDIVNYPDAYKQGYEYEWKEEINDEERIIVFEAVYTKEGEAQKNKYTVEFYAGDKLIGKSEIYEDEEIDYPDVSKDGYTYTWLEELNKFERIITATAKYTPIEYTVSFLADEKLVYKATFTTINKEIEVPAIPLRKGYSGKWQDYELGLNDVTVNAIYTPIEYSVSFVADGIVIKEVKYSVENKEIDVPTVPNKDGYKGEWEKYELDASDVIVNAVYTKISDEKVDIGCRAVGESYALAACCLIIIAITKIKKVER